MNSTLTAVDGTMPVVLETCSVRRVSADGATLLDGVSVEIELGSRWAVRGPTGSGKTLLLRALCLLDPLEGGDVLFRGERVQHADVPAFRRQVVYLHQRPALIEGTVRENLTLIERFHANAASQTTSEDRDARISRMLESLGRPESFLDQNAADLSGGEGQLVALLRALLVEPTVLLLDEPTSALDAASVAAFESLVDAWANERKDERAFVWVTHDDRQAERVAERSIHMAAGRVETRVP